MTRVDPRIAVLAEASALLGEGPGIDQALAKLARVGLPHLGDLCAIDLTLDDGTLSRVASAHVLADKESLVTALTPVERLAAIARRRAGGPPPPGGAALDELAESPEQRAQLEPLGARTWLCVPLIGTDRVLGALTFAVTESGRRYSPPDQHLTAGL